MTKAVILSLSSLYITGFVVYRLYRLNQMDANGTMHDRHIRGKRNEHSLNAEPPPANIMASSTSLEDAVSRIDGFACGQLLNSVRSIYTNGPQHWLVCSLQGLLLDFRLLNPSWLG